MLSLPKPYYDEDGITIYHGDCREILPHLEPVDMIFTDPPYGHNNNDCDLIANIERAIPSKRKAGDDGSQVYESRPIANDGPEANELVRWLFKECKRLLKNGSCCCCCCCCGGGGPDPQFARWSLWLDEVLSFKQMVIWDKGPMGMGWHYRRSYECVLVAQRDAGKCNWYDETDRVENIIRHIPKLLPRSTDHPTPKPSELPASFIQWHTLPGDVVLDPFMGGGSTAEAAKLTGRRFIGVELDERWIEIAVKRLAQGVLAL